MKVLWNNEEVKVQRTNTFSSPYLEVKQADFVIIRMKDAGTLTVLEEDGWEAKDVLIRPRSFGMACEYIENGITISVDSPRSFSVEPEGKKDHALMVFIIGEDSVCRDDYEHVIYFEAGMHRGAGAINIEQDNTLVYLEDGAYVEKSIYAEGRKHIAVSGGGRIAHDNLSQNSGCISFTDCSDVLIENVTMTDNWGWNCVMQNCEDVLIQRVHIVGCRGNSDGFDICSSRRLTLRECFTRTNDDSLVVKSHGPNVEDLLFERCVLWNGFARPIEVGVELLADLIRNVRFHDIDIIRSDTGYPVLGIHHGDHAVVENISFDDIRVEDAPGAQLFDIRIAKGVFNFDKNPGTGYIRDVTFNKIALVEKLPVSMCKSRIEGMNEFSNVKNVTVSNMNIHGYTASTAEQLGFEIKDFVENVQIIPDPDLPELPLVKTELTVSEPFVLCSDGMYRGKVRATLENTSAQTITTAATLMIAPSRPGLYGNEDIAVDLAAGERVEREFALALPAGNFCIHLESCDPRVFMSWFVMENALVLGSDVESAPKMKFVDCRGVCSGEVQLAVQDGYLVVKSESLKDRELTAFVAPDFEILPGQALFSSEETDFGMAPAVINGPRGGHELAPQLRTYLEITFCFRNEPKVEKIESLAVKDRANGLAYFDLGRMGIKDLSKGFRLELTVANDAPHRYPFSLFGSQAPAELCHMFAKAVLA